MSKKFYTTLQEMSKFTWQALTKSLESNATYLFMCKFFIMLAPVFTFFVVAPRHSAQRHLTQEHSYRNWYLKENIFRNLIKGNAQQFCHEPCLIKLVPSLSFVYTFIWLILFNCNNVHVFYKWIGSNKLEFILEASLFLYSG